MGRPLPPAPRADGVITPRMQRLLARLRRSPSRRPTKPSPSASPPRPPWRRPRVIFGGIVVLLAMLFWLSRPRLVNEPIELDYGPDDPRFMLSLGPLLGAEFTRGNRVTLLKNGDEIFPAMLAAIKAAEKSVTFETYIWSSGDISNQFVEALAERARAGVKVHVLADGVGMIKFKDEDQKVLLDAGVEFVAYGREHWWQIKAGINHRTHRKILVVDGRVGFAGGVCIDDEWRGNADSVKLWRETHLRVEGPVVRQMQAVFMANWLQTTARLLSGEAYFPAEPTPAEGAIAQCYKSGPDEDPENARVSYLYAIASARKSILVQHAYFVPDDLAIEMILSAVKRGVRVQVVVPAINDSAFGRAASRSRWGRLLEAGVEFHCFEPAMYHCKVMVVDDLFVTIGSVNFDNRSFRINDEMNVNVLDRELARVTREQFEQDVAQSYRLTLEDFRDRGWWQKLADHFCGLFRSQL
jgi:cardiolipin synthase